MTEKRGGMEMIDGHLSLMIPSRSEFQNRRKKFLLIEKHTIFSVWEKLLGEYYKRLFLAIEKIAPETWEVFELNPTNIKKLLDQQPCERIALDFDHMYNLMIESPDESIVKKLGDLAQNPSQCAVWRST